MKKSFTSRLTAGIQRRLLKVLLRGPNMHCPICENDFITFLPYGVNRANALCPNCGSLERTRMFWLLLKQKNGFFEKQKRILHVAPERALFNFFSNSNKFEYHPADKFTKGWEYPKGTENLDVTEINHPNDHFDFILCSHVLEHVPDDRKAMRELFRVMKPGGFGILQVPIEENRPTTYEDFSITDPRQRLIHFGQFDHVRIYGIDYYDRLKEAGFEVEIVDFWNNLSPNERFKFGLLADEKVMVVNKRT